MDKLLFILSQEIDRQVLLEEIHLEDLTLLVEDGIWSLLDYSLVLSLLVDYTAQVAEAFRLFWHEG